MKKGYRRSMSKALALLVAATVISGNFTTYTNAKVTNIEINDTSKYETRDIKVKNLIQNPGFEEGAVGWQFSGRSNVGNNNPHTGNNQGWAYGGSYVSQSLTMPYTGTYNASAWIKSAGGDAKFIIKDKITGTVLASKTMSDNWDYEKAELNNIYIEEGTEITIELWGANQWGDFDDVELIYDRTNQGNIIRNNDFSTESDWILNDGTINDGKAILNNEASKISQEVIIPSTGKYDLKIKINSFDSEVKVGVGNSVSTIKPTDGYIVIQDIEGKKDVNLNIYIEGKAEIDNLELTLDIENTEFSKPTISNIKINGNEVVGNTLSVTYNYNDADDYFEGTTKFRWLYCDTLNGEYKPIENETNSTIIVPQDASGKFIRCEVIPVNEIGIEGDSVLSSATALIMTNFITNPSFDNSNNREGWEFVNGAGIASNYKHSGVYHFFLDPGSQNQVKQTVKVPYNGYYNASAWLATGGANGGFEIRDKSTGTVLKNIVLPTNSQYIKYELNSVYLEKNQEVEIVCYGANQWVNGDDFELVYDTSIHENLILNSSFNDDSYWNIENGSILNGVAILSDEASKLSQDITVPLSGSYVLDINIKAISDNATIQIGDKSFKLDSSNDFKQLKFEDINLVANDTIDIVVNGKAEIRDISFKYDVSKAGYVKPEAHNVNIKGNAIVNYLINGDYIFNDEDSHKEGSSRYRWLVSDTLDGEYIAIEGENQKNLVISDQLKSKYIKFEVSPVDQYGVVGDAVLSNALGPVVVNCINNPSFEDRGLGWRYYGSNIRYDNSYDGAVRARIAKGSFNYITQEITVAETGVYSLAAYINTVGTGGKLGVMTLGNELKDSEITASADINKTSGYERVTLSNVELEKGEKVKIFFTGTNESQVSVDNVELIMSGNLDKQNLNNIVSLNLAEQEGNTIINKKNKSVKITVPYGTDTSKLTVNNIDVSEGSTIDIKSGQSLDLSNPMKVNITDGNGDIDQWSVECEVERKEAVVKSSNAFLQESFNWAIDKTEQFVMTGKTGLVNRDERRNDGTGIAEYIPSYWAGYYDRTAFYGRDFVHQSTGGQIAGLSNENFSMFKTFAQNATESRKWYTLWAINFDGSPHTIDYTDDSWFVREVPAQFELVQKAYEQYLWTGDERYINDPDMWNFYTKVMTDYISLHDDQNPNGIAEGYGGIFQGSCTYNERGQFPIEAGDAIGSQYQATLAYAAMLEARGEKEASDQWYKKAEDLKKYFNEEWSVIDPSKPNENYASVLQKDGTKLNDFGKENSWFIPMKLLSEPGERNNNYLDFISQKLGNGIGSTPDSPMNIEAYSYIPEVYFPYNRSEEAWKWMKYIMSVKDNPHERPQQGTNGDYPEISFTFVSNTVEGLMGIEPEAANHKVATVPRLPGEVEWVTLENLVMGDHELTVEHNGLTMTTLTNKSSEDLTWEARFYGDYKYINIDNKQIDTEQKEINGELISYANITVASNATISVEATSNEKEEDTFKDHLQIAVSEAEKITDDELSSVVPVVANEFKSALAEAKEILGNKNSTQEDIDKSFDRLSKVMQMLSFTKGDKAQLQGLIDKIEKLVEVEFIPTTWANMQSALNIANKVMADENAMEKEVNETYESLMKAFLSLRLKPNKDKLQDLIKKAEVLNKDKYTRESWSKFDVALASAKITLADKEATEDKVNSATKTLEMAMANLEEKGTSNNSGENNKPDSKPENKPGKGQNNKLPNTGAAAGSGILLTISSALVAAGCLLKRKK